MENIKNRLKHLRNYTEIERTRIISISMDIVQDLWSKGFSMRMMESLAEEIKEEVKRKLN